MNLSHVASQILNDAKIYLGSISNEAYSTSIPLLSGASVGQHTRHFIEFYQCLIDQSCDCNTISYDKRQRNYQLETDPAFACDIIDSISDQLLDRDQNQDLILTSEYNLDKDNSSQIQSNFERELAYNIEHTIHHLAIIKIGLKLTAPDIPIPEKFGVAPSTLRYRNSIPV